MTSGRQPPASPALSPAFAVHKKTVARENKTRIEQSSNLVEAKMVRLARESMALASVAGFVWMVCAVAHLVA
jgi:hypothetical protein